jgi:ubiquinone/menaquinone biosynthesis C-methylase UbiE
MPEEIPWPFSRFYDRFVNRTFTKWFKHIAENVKDRQISGVILDIGTGPGRLPIEIAKQMPDVEVIGIDLSEDMVRIANRNAEKEELSTRVKFRVGSAYATGFLDDSVDLVTSTGMIHHLQEPISAFNEIHRILKGGAEAWIYDGRKDVTKTEFEETVRKLGMDELLPLRLWIIERIWPHLHTGFKTDEYISGKIGRALEKSRIESHELNNEGAYMRITLKKDRSSLSDK